MSNLIFTDRWKRYIQLNSVKNIRRVIFDVTTVVYSCTDHSIVDGWITYLLVGMNVQQKRKKALQTMHVCLYVQGKREEKNGIAHLTVVARSSKYVDE